MHAVPEQVGQTSVLSEVLLGLTIHGNTLKIAGGLATLFVTVLNPKKQQIFAPAQYSTQSQR